MNLRQAVTIIAKAQIATGAEWELGEAWEMWPEVGEHDWERIQAEARRLIEKLRPPRQAIEAAEMYLEARASNLI